MRYDNLVKGIKEKDVQYLCRIAHYNDNGHVRTFASYCFNESSCTYKVIYVGTIGYIIHNALYSRELYVDECNKYWVKEPVVDDISDPQKYLDNYLVDKNRAPSNITCYVDGKFHPVSEQMQKEYDSMVMLYATRPDVSSSGDASVFEYEL